MQIVNKQNLNRLVRDLTFRIPIGQYLLDHVYTNADAESIDKIRRAKEGQHTINLICPFHNETKPSFRIYTNKNDYFCYGQCHRGGNVIQLHAHNLEVNEGRFLSYPDLVLDLARLYNVQHDPIYENQIGSSIYAKCITEEDFERVKPRPVTFDKKPTSAILMQILKRIKPDLLPEAMYLTSLGLPEEDMQRELTQLINAKG